MRAPGLLLALVLVLAGCKPGPSNGEPPDPSASPQAKAEPAPIASLPTPTSSGTPPTFASLDGGISPQPLRADREVGSDSLFGTFGKEGQGYTLSAVFRQVAVPIPTKAPEVSLAGLEVARRRTEPELTIDLAPVHARIVLGGGFVLPPGTELRARADRYGSVIVAPDGAWYRVAEPGSMRALLGEQRLDVAPLSAAEVTAGGEGTKRLGRLTRRAVVTTRAADASFEIAHLSDLGEGGALVCRALLDLINAPPSTPLCGEGDLPMHADLRWTTHGEIIFEVVAIARRVDLSASVLATPPATAAFAEGAMPRRGAGLQLTRTELAALRTGPEPTPVGPPPPGAPPVAATAPTAISSIDAEPVLTLANSTDELRFAFLDGVPIAWVDAGGRIEIRGLLRGHYVLQWRTFLGDAVEPPQTITLPATSDLGAVDGGVSL